MKGNILISIIVGFAILIGGLVLVTKTTDAHGLHVTICHVPPPTDLTLSVDFSALGGHLGHGDYLGSCEEEEPSPTSSVSPSPTLSPEPSPEPSPSPSPSPEPSPVPCEQTEEGCPVDYCDTLEGVQKEDEDCPREEPSPTPVPLSEPQQGCTQSCGGGEPKDIVCDLLPPAAPVFLHYEKIDNGWKLLWIPSSDDIDSQRLQYGYTSDNLEYGIYNLPENASEVNIYGLTKTPFWFTVASVKGNCVNFSGVVDPE